MCSCESWNWCRMGWGTNSTWHDLFFPKLSVAVEVVSTVGNGPSLGEAVAIILLWASFPECTPVVFGIRLFQEGTQHSQLFCYPRLFAKLKWVYLLFFLCIVAQQLLGPSAKPCKNSKPEQISTENLTEAATSHLVACWKLPEFLMLCVLNWQNFSYFAKPFYYGGNEIWNQASLAWFWISSQITSHTSYFLPEGEKLQYLSSERRQRLHSSSMLADFIDSVIIEEGVRYQLVCDTGT